MAGERYLVEHDVLVAALEARADYAEACALSGKQSAPEEWDVYRTAIRRITAYPLAPRVTADLVNAAPNLLAVCVMALTKIEKMPSTDLGGHHDYVVTALKAAIAKARGGG